MNDELVSREEKIVTPDFYVVAPKKFITLFVASFGIYSVYWFYMQWDFHQKRTNGKQWPIMRAVFPIFFAHSLFSLFSLALHEKHNEKAQNFSKYATIFVVATILAYMGDQLAMNDIGSPLTGLVIYATLPLTGWVLYQMQLVVNSICGDFNGESNNSYTFANYVWLFLGAVLWILTLLGAYQALFLDPSIAKAI